MVNESMAVKENTRNISEEVYPKWLSWELNIIHPVSSRVAIGRATSRMISRKVLREKRSAWDQVSSTVGAEKATLEMILTKMIKYKMILQYRFIWKGR